MGRDDGRAMQAVKVFRTGMPRPFTDVAEAEFQILDSKDIALADTTGELPGGVDLPRAGAHIKRAVGIFGGIGAMGMIAWAGVRLGNT